ncbi:MAG: COG1615 family transporter [Nonomuraea sp.]|nr:COG1615 family transporter [Nonomuraea sp.]
MRLPRRPRLLLPVAIALVAIVALFFLFSGIYTDYLWFDSINYTGVFSGVLLTQIVLFLVGALLMVGITGGNMLLAFRMRPMFGPAMFGGGSGADRYRMALDPHRKLIFIVGMGILALFSGSSFAGQWKTWMEFVNGVDFGKKDALFGKDISFFTFDYPFIRMALNFLFTAIIISIILAVITHYLYGGFRLQSPGVHASRAARAHLSVLLGLFVLLKAVAYWVDQYALVFSDRGKVFGASYTDVHAVLPAKTILAIIALICALLFFAGVVRPGGMLPGVAFGLLVLSAVLIGGVYPALVEQFQVKPNQQAKEHDYIDRNIKATRDAYKVADADVQQYTAKTDADASVLQTEANAIPGMRLLDPSLLSPTYQQKQQIRGYYKFPDQLDIDRYPDAEGKSRDTVIALREMGQPPEQERNWINSHLVYTHGFGVVAAPGNKVDQGGLPVFSEKDIPPTGTLGKYEPRIYFGENSPEYSIVGGPNPVPGKGDELDYPEQGGNGQQNNTYAGKGGVPIGNFINRLVYAVKYGETNILLSSDINDASRIMYQRTPIERVEKVAPFLTTDQDPYPAVVGGRIVWIVDAYTTTDSYPYSQRKSLSDLTTDVSTERQPGVPQQLPRDEINYMRNSVKAVVDAYDGSVTLYAWDDADPVLKTWEGAFPGIIKPKSAISGELMAHLRYPADLFKAQREILTQYHVTDANAFFGGQDFWKVPEDPATGKSKQPPYYVTMKMPQGTEKFSLTTTFVPNGRQNMAAFMAVDATADPSQAKLQILQLPSNTAIQGPPQAQNTFESDPVVSQQLNLLRGQGGATEVLYGNLLTLPFGGGLIYVEPVYVQPKAETSGKFPSLRKVLVMFGDKVGFGDTLEDALKQVFGAAPPTTNTNPEQGKPTNQTPTALTKAISDAQQAYTDAQNALKASPPDWDAYGKAQTRLQDALKSLEALGAAKPTTTATSTPTPTPTPSASASATPSASPSG